MTSEGLFETEDWSNDAENVHDDPEMVRCSAFRPNQGNQVRRFSVAFFLSESLTSKHMSAP